MVRSYSSVAVVTSLAGGINAAVTSIAVGSVTGFPITYPYTLSIDASNANKELVEVTAAAGTTLTVTRGIDGTSATSHTLGAVVSHDHSARDFKESRVHEAATIAHGTAGNVVGTTDTQVLTNKDLSAGTNIFPSSLATDAEVTTAVGTAVSAAIATEVTNRNSAITTATSGLQPAATAVTLTGTQTLDNKTLNKPTIRDQVPVRDGFPARLPYVASLFSDLAVLDGTHGLPLPYGGDLAGVYSGAGAVYTYTGGAWKALATEAFVGADSGWINQTVAASPIGAGTRGLKARTRGGRASIRGNVVRSGDFISGTGYIVTTIDSQFRPATEVRWTATTDANGVYARVILATNGDVSFIQSGSNPAGSVHLDFSWDLG